MSDWPGSAGSFEAGFLSTAGLESTVGHHSDGTGRVPGSSAWPATNTAIYVPVKVQQPCTVYKMSFTVAVQSGNYDIGIYDEAGNRIVSKGSTAVPVAGLAVTDIADTTLSPAVYLFALNIDNTTASVFRFTIGFVQARGIGVRQQAVGAVALPNPAVFASPTGTQVPIIVAHLAATV